MAYEVLDIGLQRVMENTAGNVEEISRYCDVALAGLKEVYDQQATTVYLGAKLTIGQDRTSLLTTPFGEARGALYFKYAQEEIVGSYVFEKCVKDQLGQTAWTPVWGFDVRQYGQIFVGGTESLIVDQEKRGLISRDPYKATAYSICYAIAKAPVFLTSQH